MLLPLIDIALFRDAIEQDYLIITPNHRLAAKISEAWSLDCQTRNSVWRTPRVFAIDHWLKHCWDELQDQNNMALSGKAVVGLQQSRYYWERAINENDPDLSSQYAKMVSQTYSTLEQWDLTVDQVHDDTPAITYLRRWSKSYRHLLRMNTLLTPAESWQSILKAFQEGLLSTETTILTYGFQSQPPLIEKLLNTASPNTRPIESDKHRANSHVVTAVDHEEELRSVASWAAQKLTQQRYSRPQQFPR